MRGGVLQLRRWGVLDRVAATGAPPVRRVTFHYGDESMPVALKPSAGVDALYAPRRTVLDALLVDAAEEAGARVRFGCAVTDLARDGAGRVIGVVLRDRGGATRTEKARLVIGADGRDSVVAARVAAPTIAAGAHTAAYAYGYWPAAGPRRLPLVLRRRAVRRGDPDQRRPRVRVRRRSARGGRRGVAPSPAARCAAGTAGPVGRRSRRPRRGAAGRPRSGLPRSAGPAAPSVRARLGAGGRLRLVEGPAVHPRDHRSPARRGAAHRRRRRRGGVASRAAQLALAGYQERRDRLALPMHPIVDRLASHEWDPPRCAGCCAGCPR